MRITNRGWYKWVVTTFFAACGAYAYSTHVLGFIGASRSEKLIQIGISFLVSAVIFSLLASIFFKQISSFIPRKIIIKVGAACTLFSAAALLIIYKPPPFPEHHTLEIQVPASNFEQANLEEQPLQAPRDPASELEEEMDDGGEILADGEVGDEEIFELQKPVQITAIQRINYPSGDAVGIEPAEMQQSGDWQVLENNTLFWEGGESGLIRYEAFMQAGIDLVFNSGPDQGVIMITWDGYETIVDLSQFPAGSYTKHLEPSFNITRADFTRQVFAISALFADYAVLSSLLAFLILLLYRILKDRVMIRNPRLLAAGAVVLAGLIFPVYSYMKPVEFTDSNFEALIRRTIGNKDRPIYRNQLLTIAVLEGYHSYISNLEGIQYLRNLSELNLRRNQVRDINPLSRLKHLRKLNLRENPVSDLTPLAKSTSLVYLNLYSDSNVTSIEPLAGLSNLETLILAEIPIRDEVKLISTFPHLKHLNLRNCGISDLSTVASLTNLEYVNLYGNYRIRSIKDLLALPNLHTLILGEVPIGGEANLLAKMGSLQHLNLRKTGITDLSPLAGLSQLTYLNLHSNPGIESITPLSGLRSLRILILEDVPVGSQVNIIANFPKLVRLNLRNTGISDTSVIGQLLAGGAFQDDRLTGEKGSISITGNPLATATSDVYAPLRPYWENVSLRDPYVLPQFPAMEKPIFSQPAGFFDNAVQLELTSSNPAATIHYTLDGSEPALDSLLYTSPILIESREGEANRLSANSQTSPYWKQPDGEVFKATVVKARVFDASSGESSRTETRTYFIGQNIKEKYSLPVISLVSGEDNFFGYKDGIYVKGLIYDQNYSSAIRNLTNIPANYYQGGMVWERPVHIEIFQPGGQLVFSQNGGMHIHGHATRVLPQKSLRFFARTEYDASEYFNFELFPGLVNRIDNKPVEQFDNFILRDSGNDWDNAFMRDALMQKLVSSTALDTQAYLPVIVFINGEYWGIHDLRQRMDQEYLASMYLADPGQFDILDFENRLPIGDADDADKYTTLLDFMENNNLGEQANYEYIQTKIDIDNYLDYVVAEIYSANADWPHNNVRLWRLDTASYRPEAPAGKDGRWRWMLFDTDLGLGLNPNHGSYLHRTLEIAASEKNKHFLLYYLLTNYDFKNRLINRAADSLNTIFKESQVLESINEMQAVLQPEMGEHIRRWRTMGDDIEGWEYNVDVLRDFASQRPKYLREQIIEQFGLQGTAILTVQADTQKGFVRVNSIDVGAGTTRIMDSGNWSGIYFTGVPIQIQAIPKTGFRFAGWEGSQSSSENLTITLKDALTLKANFEPIP